MAMAKIINQSTAVKGVKADKPLAPNALMFVDHYVISRNGKQAAIEAGYSPKTAEQQASRLLRNVKVKQLIDDKLQKLSEITGVTAERVLREVGAMALSDVRKLFDEQGRLLPIVNLDDATAAAVASIEVDVLYEGSGKDREAIGTTTKIKMWDKNSAAEKLMRHLGLFKEDNKQKVDPLAELLGLIAERGNRLPIKEQT